MSKSTDWIVVGRFGRTHGVKGKIIIHSFTHPSENIEQYSQLWYAYINKQWQLIKPMQIEITAKHILAQIKNYDTQEQVSKLTNTDIAIPKENLASLPAGEFYWHELIGMHVENTAGLCLGEVSDVLATGSNDVLVVEGDKRHLIPYIMDQFIIKINKEQGLIVADWDIDF
jgi:16S rRNA processing protein RimM